MAENRISGKIVEAGTGLGIQNVLVTIFDVDPNTEPEEILGGPSFDPAVSTIAPLGGSPPVDRLGSVVSNENGEIEFIYQDEDFRVRNEQERRPDLLLVVTAPEQAGQDLRESILFHSAAVRHNAGRSEGFVIRLTEEQLQKAGIPLPTTPAAAQEEPARVVERLLASGVRTNALIEGLRKADRTLVERTRETDAGFEADLRPQLRQRLSRVPEDMLASPTFVAPGEPLAKKSTDLMGAHIQEVINTTDSKIRPPVSGFLVLTQEQKDALAPHTDGDGYFTEEVLQEVLRNGDDPARPAPLTSLVREDPIKRFCRERSEDEREAAAALGLPDGTGDAEDEETEEEDAGEEATSSDALTEGDVLSYTGRLMSTLTSPEERVLTGLEPRASRTSVESAIQGLNFGPGPADVPAYYDFHSLQLAFPHVWQEVIDEGLLDLGADAYREIVELGGNPSRPPSVMVDPVLHLRREGLTVMAAHARVRDHRNRGSSLFDRIQDLFGGSGGWRPGGDNRPPRDPRPGRQPAEPDPLERLPALLGELERRLKEDYAFTIYAANRKERSVNFAILVTYRQKWEPLGYQAGRLIKTLTLAPRETRRYSKKQVTHRKRAVREVEHHVRFRRQESSQTTRSEQDIVRKASHSTNFSLTSEESVQTPGGVGGGATHTTSFQQAASKVSEDTKKAFHEAVFKAAQEFKDENTLEVNTEVSEDVELVESGEINNVNDELALNCVFYELQRCYRVTEQIHRITPVILVAQEVPRPDEINEAWIITHDWILRRVLLDDSFLPALDYVSQNVVGDEVALREMRENVQQQRRIVEELRTELGVVRDRVATYRQLLERSLLRKASGGGGGILGAVPVVGGIVDSAVDAVEGVAGQVGDFLFSGNPGGQTAQDALRDALDRTADEERNLLFRLEREVTALNDITNSYSRLLSEHFNHKAEIDRLRVHIKQNILYYMQAVWSHEPPDQRFFRLHNTPVPVMKPKLASKKFRFQHAGPARGALAGVAHRRLFPDHIRPGELYPVEVVTQLEPPLATEPLSKVADIGRFVGFTGNCIMFELRQSNPLTDFMMHPYVVAGLDELVDPDDLGNWNLEDFSRYVLCLKERLTSDQFEQIRPELVEQHKRILTNPRPNGDVITVPTNSLFIELMPSENSHIERYKRDHRVQDVKKVQAEVRQAELENVRMAARILAGELDDPTIEKKIVVEGGPVPISDT